MPDLKITQLTELAATPDNADILAIVDDVAVTPITKKITVANLLSGTKIGGLYGLNVETLSGAKTLTPNVDYIYQDLNTNGDWRNISLATTTSSVGDRFVISNNGAEDTYALRIYKKGGEAGDHLDQVFANSKREYIYNGTDWIRESGYGAALGYSTESWDKGAALGYNAMGYQQGVGIGYRSRGYANGVAVGYGAWCIGGVCIGHNSGDSRSYFSTTIGREAGNANSASYITALGYKAAKNNSGERILALGYESLATSTANDVVAIGYQAGYGNTIANQFIVQQKNINEIPLIQGDFSSGNVGIGTKSPATKLDVAGTFQVSSAVALSLGGYVRKFAEATGTPAGATTYFDIAVDVPAGAKLLGVQLRVDAALTTGETWGATYVTGSTTVLAAAGQAVAINTKVNKMHVDEITSDVTNVRITRDAGSFTDAAGVVRAIVYYETFTAMGNK